MREEIDYTFTKNYYELLDFKRDVDNIYITKQRVKEVLLKLGEAIGWNEHLQQELDNVFEELGLERW